MTTTDPADERMRDLADQRAEDFVNNLTGRAEPEQPWDEAGCSRSCRTAHTRRWGSCAYAEEPTPTLSRFETGVAADGYVSGGYEPMSVEQVAAWLHEQGYTVAPRASQGHQEPASVPDGPGAAQGADGGSAAESEPRGIVGPGYDAVWTYIRTHPGDAYRNAAIWRAVEAFRDAVIPAIRAQVADEIDQRLDEQGDGSEWDNGMMCAAEIARGDQ